MLSTEIITAKVEEVLKDSSLLKLKNVMDVNHKPHPYTIGSRHVVHASDNWGGMLGEATLKAVPCAATRCGLSYEQHTFDRVVFLQLQRNCTGDEVQPELKAIVDSMPKGSFAGICFVDTEERFRIN